MGEQCMSIASWFPSEKNCVLLFFFYFSLKKQKKHTTILNDIISYQIAFYMFIEVLIVLLLSFTSILSHINTIHHKTTSAPIKLFLRLHTLNFCNFFFSLLVDFSCLSRSHWCYFSCVKLRPSNILTVESVTKWLDNSNAQWHVINLASSFFFSTWAFTTTALCIYSSLRAQKWLSNDKRVRESEQEWKGERERFRDDITYMHKVQAWKSNWVIIKSCVCARCVCVYYVESPVQAII